MQQDLIYLNSQLSGGCDDYGSNLGGGPDEQYTRTLHLTAWACEQPWSQRTSTTSTRPVPMFSAAVAAKRWSPGHWCR